MINRTTKYLGIDWGSKRIGLALGDSETKIATPFKVVENLDEVIKIISEEDIDELIIGSPINMKGEFGQMKDKIDEFVKALKQKINITVRLIDERLSSKAADALSGTKKTKASRDAMAAMIILQGYLDKK